MSRKILAIVAVAAAIAVAAWLGFSDGREHRQDDRAESTAR